MIAEITSEFIRLKQEQRRRFRYRTFVTNPVMLPDMALIDMARELVEDRHRVGYSYMKPVYFSITENEL